MCNKNVNKYFKAGVAAAVVVSSGIVVAPNVSQAEETQTTISFKDLTTKNQFYNDIMNLAQRGILKGFPDKTFGTYKEITRGQAAKILAKVLELDTENVTDPGFVDVKKGHEYYGAIAALQNAGIINGYSTDNTFRMNELITRNHMAKMLIIGFGLEANSAAPFTDMHDYYKDFIAALYENKVTTGRTSTTFDGISHVTRGQMAAFAVRAERIEKEVTFTIKDIEGGKIITTEGQFRTSLPIFNSENASALEGAVLKAVISKGQVKAIKALALNNSGSEENPVVLDGKNAVIDGNLTVNADFTNLKNMTINEDVILTSTVANNFDANGLNIQGELVIAEGAQAQLASLNMVANSVNGPKVNLSNSTVKAIITKRNNVVITSNNKLPELKVAANVSSIELNANVEKVTVSESETLQIKGSASIDNMDVQQATNLDLAVTGSVKQLDVANANAKVSLGENVAVEKLVVPTDSDISTIINDYEIVKEKIEQVVDNSGTVAVPPGNNGGNQGGDGSPGNNDGGNTGTPGNGGNPGNGGTPGGDNGDQEVNPAVATVSNLSDLNEALANNQIKTITLNADLENLTERIVINRPVTINGNGKTISFTNEINTKTYGSRHGILVQSDNVTIKDLSVVLTEKAEWQGAYAVQVYNAKNVTLHNFSGTNADAALLVNSSTVKLTGTIDVSGNEFGGIEVSNGVGVEAKPSLDVTDALFVNTTEAFSLPTIWEDKITGSVVGAGTKLTDSNEVVETQVQYYLNPANVVNPAVAKVSSLSELNEALADNKITTIKLNADIENLTERIVINRPVTIEGNGKTISFTDEINTAAKGSRHGIAVTSDNVVIKDLSVELTEKAEWQGAYAVQVYNAKNVTLHNFSGTNADAALLVNGSTVELTGKTVISGNEFGGIEVSQGTGLSNQSKLTVTSTIENTTEQYGQPSIWVVNGQGSVDGEVPTTVDTLINSEQTQYYISETAVSTKNVNTVEDLKIALTNDKIKTIKLANDIKTSERIIVNRSVTLDGANHKITFEGDAKDAWNSNYIIQVYNTADVTIRDIKLTGGDAALLVNSSKVKLAGTIDVSGNEFGGIESSVGKNLTTKPELDVKDATFVNNTEAYGLPTIWEDKVTETVKNADVFTTNDSVVAQQVRYYLDANKAIDSTTIANVKNVEELEDALEDNRIKTINLTVNLEISERIIVNRPVTINGANHTIEFVGDNDGWNSNYVIQVYNTADVTIRDINLTGGDAALLVNSSSVKLAGTIDVSGNEFGGIESSVGKNLTSKPELDVKDATFVNSTEAYGLPTIWEDQITGSLVGVETKLFENANVKEKQVQYYLNAEFATIANVASVEAFEKALEDDKVKTINLNADLDNLAKRIVIGRSVTVNGNNHSISFNDAINTASDGTRHGIAVLSDDVTINDLSVALTEQADWQGAYAIQVYNAKNVVLNNFTGTKADAALLINASDVQLTGSITVSGNEFGGIEVSKGTAASLSASILDIKGTLVNTTEAHGKPTIWVVKDQGTVTGEFPTNVDVEKIKPGQIQYYLN